MCGVGIPCGIEIHRIRYTIGCILDASGAVWPSGYLWGSKGSVGIEGYVLYCAETRWPGFGTPKTERNQGH